MMAGNRETDLLTLYCNFRLCFVPRPAGVWRVLPPRQVLCGNCLRAGREGIDSLLSPVVRRARYCRHSCAREPLSTKMAGMMTWFR